MALVLEQKFLTGRYNASRWNQSPFEDSHGEWPPSPWRLLRTLLARWFEYAREMGDWNTNARDQVLALLASSPPEFRLPTEVTHTSDWSSRGIRQYQPTSLEKSDPKKGQPWLRRPQTTLIIDSFAIIPRDANVVWIWKSINTEERSAEVRLLDCLLRRITYFGRAESLSLFTRRGDAGVTASPNCSLHQDFFTGSPVLIADPGKQLNLEVLLASTDDRILRGHRIPPGTTWWYAERPAPARPKTIIARPAFRPRTMLHFAIGGRVLPTPESWIRISERFRGTVLKELARMLNPTARRFEDLSEEERVHYSLMSGKSSSTEALQGAHLHLRMWVLPDEKGHASRLVCFRQVPFDEREQEAFLRASRSPVSWQYGNPDWMLRIVPLTDATPLPRNCFGSSQKWESVSPYVPSRHVLGRNGQPRPGRSVEVQVQDDLKLAGFPEAKVSVNVDSQKWVKVHAPKRLRAGQTNELKLGYRVQLEFGLSVQGPICIGHSSHFGLGVFAAISLANS